ncbi:MAG: tRNA pseudouridine(38-40) synthase TruA [Candidatus Cloacimonetes bacterium]|nr:tRNA pseudouridine(38-40) synthase TruA [Candidatus Cloacimonadota bacterium]
MKRFAILISYDGSKFYGWQVQIKSPTVEDCLEKALYRIAKVNIKVTGAGRTDSGVHAKGQVAHFDFPVNMTPSQLLLAINSLVQPFIKVLDLVEVSSDFHSRFDATLRSYKYIITLDKTPFNYHYKTAFPRYNIDLKRMKACVPFFLGEHKFTSFAKPNPEITNHICDVKSFTINQIDIDIVLEITANRFLHHMVRRIVGALVSVSHKYLNPDIIKTWIDLNKHEQKNYFTAPPNGLYLIEVSYPKEKLDFTCK